MKNTDTIRLNSGRVIGHGHPCFIVAEIGNNHQGELPLAKEMIIAAAEAGAQAVKFQKRDMDALFTRAGREAPYGGPNSFAPTYGEHRNKLELSIEDMAECKSLADSLGLVFFASAWDMVSLKQMFELDVELLKICSADLVNVPMLRTCAASGLPIILSTGMSDWGDIDTAVAELRRFHEKIILLHCNSTYPCPDEQLALPVMKRLKERYELPVGYSGHELGIGPSLAAAVLGACIIERHFTLDKTMRGTDHKVSLEPGELKQLVSMVREAELACRVTNKMVFEGEEKAASKLRKSIVFTRDLPAGHVLTESDLAVKCPGTGVSPVHWDDVLGSRLCASVSYEQQVSWDSLAPREVDACEKLENLLN